MDIDELNKEFGEDLIARYIDYYWNNLGCKFNIERLNNRLSSIKPDLKGLTDEIYDTVKDKVLYFDYPEFILAETNANFPNIIKQKNIKVFKKMCEIRCGAILALAFEKEFKERYLVTAQENPDILMVTLNKDKHYRNQIMRLVEVTLASITHEDIDSNTIIANRIKTKNKSYMVIGVIY